MNEMQAKHAGFVEKRIWHKIRWVKNPPGKNFEGRSDIFDDEDLKKYKEFASVIETFKTDKCATGVSMDFGRTNEENIDEWIRNNRR